MNEKKYMTGVIIEAFFLSSFVYQAIIGNCKQQQKIVYLILLGSNILYRVVIKHLSDPYALTLCKYFYYIPITRYFTSLIVVFS